MTTELKSAIENLKIANEKYVSACKEKFGRYIDDTELYVKIVGQAWRNYLSAGGSLSCVNH